MRPSVPHPHPHPHPGTLRFAQRAKAVPVIVRPNTTVARADAARLESNLSSMGEELAAAHVLIERLRKELQERDGLNLDAQVCKLHTRSIDSPPLALPLALALNRWP